MTAPTAETLIEDIQLNSIDALLKDFNRDQLIWLSGYVAAFAKGLPSGSENSNEDSKVLIAYGTETGNSQGIASDLAFAFDQHKITFDLKNLSQLRARHLVKYKFIFVICSTHGDGDPPETVNLFYTSIMGADAPRLTEARYAVLALGDSSYPRFCATGQELDDRLSALGAGRLIFRQDCDVDYAETAKKWISNLVNLLASKLPKSGNTHIAKVATSTKKTELNKNNPVRAEVIENICLSEADRLDVIHHIELSCDEQLSSLQPGDAVGVLVENPVQLARQVIERIGCNDDSVVLVNHRNIPLLQALIEECDITVPSRKLLIEWMKFSDNDFIRQVLDDDHALRSFLKTHQITDIAERFPAVIDAQSFVDGLRPLQPRLYDLANSLRQTPDELHLLVKRYQYSFNDRLCTGVASDYLLHLKPGDTVRLFPYRNSRFHLPMEDDAPIIYIAESTGIATFRAFTQELSLSEKKRPCWLIFTENTFEEDFLYQSEWQTTFADGRLEKIDTIFRNQSEGPRSIQDLLHIKQEEFIGYLGKGAHIYLGGDKALLTEVEKSLEMLVSESLLSWPALHESSRIHRNLY